MIKSIEWAGDILQYAFPTVVGLADTLPDVWAGQYQSALTKLVTISGLILIQNRGTKVIKRLVQKPRPLFPHDLESFPSGHMMIATQCATRVFAAYTQPHLQGLSLFTCATIGLGRYLPGKHDIVDLTVGGALGIVLGAAWNRLISES